MPRSVIFNRFPEVAAAMAGEVAATVNETATTIEQDVKGGAHAAPIDTGNLRRSYHTKFTSSLSDPKAEVGNDPAVAHYAIFQEYGTYKMAARPHLRPAVMAAAGAFKARIAAILGGAGA